MEHGGELIESRLSRYGEAPLLLIAEEVKANLIERVWTEQPHRTGRYYRDGGTVLGVAGFRLTEKLTIRPTMAPMPPPMAWPNNNLEVAYRMTSGIWTTAGICAPCGRPPGDVYHESIGGTRNEATAAPSRAPASMRMSAVFTIQTSITRGRRHHPGRALC